MAKKSPAINATVEPASLIEISKKWAHDIITPEIRSGVIDSISLMADSFQKIKKLADLLHAQGVLHYHVHLTREEKKQGGDIVSKYDAIRMELDTIFDSRLSEAQREEIKTIKSKKDGESNLRSIWRQRLRAELITLEDVAAFANPNSDEEGEGEGAGKSTKTDHQKGVERLQSALKAFQKVEPATVGYNVQQFCEGLEKLIAHAVAHGSKPE